MGDSAGARVLRRPACSNSTGRSLGNSGDWALLPWKGVWPLATVSVRLSLTLLFTAFPSWVLQRGHGFNSVPRRGFQVLGTEGAP